MHVSGMTLSVTYTSLNDNMERELLLIDALNTSNYHWLIRLCTVLLFTILPGHCLPYSVARTIRDDISSFDIDNSQSSPLSYFPTPGSATANHQWGS
jgi:hypothetical protein